MRSHSLANQQLISLLFLYVCVLPYSSLVYTLGINSHPSCHKSLNLLFLKVSLSSTNIWWKEVRGKDEAEEQNMHIFSRCLLSYDHRALCMCMCVCFKSRLWSIRGLNPDRRLPGWQVVIKKPNRASLKAECNRWSEARVTSSFPWICLKLFVFMTL